MKVNQAEFVISAVGPSQYPADGFPEVALTGRSNVGKSSLINRLIQRKNLARTSGRPGKTQQLNYYRINQDLFFVDLPGYGYAQVSRTERAKWGKFIEAYLTKRELLKLILVVIDLRHPPSKDDQAMYGWLKHNGLPVCIVVTKADKIPKGKWAKHVKIVKETLEADPADPVIVFSSETGLGKDELWDVIQRHIGYRNSADEHAEAVREDGAEESAGAAAMPEEGNAGRQSDL